ncbi:UNVERIFIED_CONTAM: Clavaminate synthase-like protein [Sesamum radiatum]|uniref:Clavaminate synthase-like protein n=1 Tax=Sesamum radiatum TaxID=300843 RepID=A0AAW2V8E0_SESRA
MEFTCKDFKVGKCEGEKLVHGETIPLVLQPPTHGKRDVESLLEALGRNKEWFEEMIIKNSAVLLRGFEVKNAQEFNDIVEVFGWGTYGTWALPPGRTYTREFGQLMKDLSLIPPPEGGETPFVPSFRVTERMMEEFPKFVEELDQKGLRYTFTALSKDDKSSMRGRGWEDAFGTSDPAEAERRAKALGMDMEWLPNGGVKTILGPRSLTRVFDGRKGRRMWFNTHGGNARKGAEFSHNGGRN